MNKIINIRQLIKNIYTSYEAWIVPVIKALIMLFVILVMNSKFGYNEGLMSWNAVLLLILVAALLPWQGITFLSAGILLIHLFSLSWEVAVVTAAFILVIAVAQYIFLPGFSLAVVLIPLLFGIKLAYVVPLILGIMGSTLCFIPASCGVFLYYFLLGVEKNADVFGRTTGSAAGALERFPQIISIIKDNDIMVIGIIAFAVTTVVVSVIRKISADFSIYIALAVGAIANIIIYLVGGYISDLSIDFVWIFVGNVLAFIIACISAFWLLAGDYGHSQYLQFEDENYIYHVKAIPKLNINPKKIKVHDISIEEEEEENRDIKDALKILDEIDKEERRKEDK